MNIALIGASGFVGRHVLDLLRYHEFDVISVKRQDITNGNLIDLAEKCDALINCAGEKTGIGAEAHDANVRLPQDLVKIASSLNLKTMVHVSSVAALTSVTMPHEVVTDAYTGLPDSEYGKSKRNGDDKLCELAADLGYKNLVILRPPALIGVNAPGVFSILLKFSQSGIPLPLGGVDNRRSFMHVSNFAMAILEAVTQNISGTYIVTDSKPISTEQVYVRLLKAAGFENRTFSLGQFGRSLMKSCLGSRGVSLFDSSAFDGSRFISCTNVTWPVLPNEIFESALAENRK